jgi:hypothetical protein
VLAVHDTSNACQPRRNQPLEERTPAVRMKDVRLRAPQQPGKLQHELRIVAVTPVELDEL